MAEGPGGEKTEQPTAKKRSDARKEGNVLQSKDVSTVVVLLGIFCLLRILLPYIYRDMREFMIYILKLCGADGASPVTPRLFIRFLFYAMKSALPLLLTTMLLGILGTGAQTRFNITFQKLKFKLSNMNPLNGIKKVFSLKNLVELLKNLLKITILIVLLYTILKDDILPIARMINMNLLSSTVLLLRMIFDLVIRVCMAFIVIAFFDFLYQRWDYENGLKMTKQEVKDEFKNTEGNPEIKGRIRSLMRQRANQRMMQQVPEADVIIRNPTHLAIALKYDPEKAGAPLVLAKGQDQVALRIVRIAEEHGVIVMENKDLARAMYPMCELNREIPAEFYGAVAEILVYIYKQQNREDMLL